jgi:hypothetical protein
LCRNPSGEIRTYPVVEMEFHPEANQVEYVICPPELMIKVAEKRARLECFGEIQSCRVIGRRNVPNRGR